eukprot:GILJ01003379.1.p1 GENE.GILJ01003379.1~~GILJ01003379.1.p1  ORF type:complete len:550 (+),score=108.60 GILJ01003379.1:1-1650(+)
MGRFESARRQTDMVVHNSVVDDGDDDLASLMPNSLSVIHSEVDAGAGPRRERFRHRRQGTGRVTTKRDITLKESTVGLVGRRTGIKPKENVKRDEDGLENVDDFFGSDGEEAQIKRKSTASVKSVAVEQRPSPAKSTTKAAARRQSSARKVSVLSTRFDDPVMEVADAPEDDMEVVICSSASPIRPAEEEPEFRGPTKLFQETDDVVQPVKRPAAPPATKPQRREEVAEYVPDIYNDWSGAEEEQVTAKAKPRKAQVKPKAKQAKKSTDAGAFKQPRGRPAGKKKSVVLDVPDEEEKQSEEEEDDVKQAHTHKRKKLDVQLTPDEKEEKERQRRERIRQMRLSEISGPVEQDNGRYPNRKRIPPTKFWKNERLVYHRTEKDEVMPTVSGVIHVSESEATPAPKRRRRIVHDDEDEAFEEEVDPIAEVIDHKGRENNKVVIRARNMLSFEKLPSSSSKAAIAFDEPDFMSCVIEIPPLGSKANEKNIAGTMAFTVLAGAVRQVEFSVHKSSFLLSAGDHFLVPTDNVYSIHNKSKTAPVKLLCCIIKPAL